MKKRGLCASIAFTVFVLGTDIPASTAASLNRPEETVPASFYTQVIEDLHELNRSHAAEKSAGIGSRREADLAANEWSKPEAVITSEQVNTGPSSALDMLEVKKAWQEAGVKGEGMLVSIIDTGVNPHHPDMAPLANKQAAKQKSGSTQKVISGYNWADRNQTTVDAGESQHGMHVAGIVAANGKLKGVAPEAQLLSQKVFSNYQGEVSGLSESILFAINDSVAKKADVINLSLGSSAGYVDETNMEQYAIKRAVDHGVIVVAAAGNDGYFGSDKVKAENPDVSMIGSPGLAPDAFSVASANSASLAGISFAVTGVSGLERVVYFTGHASEGEALNPVQSLPRSYQLVYMGKGKKEDYHVSVKDKVVLVERGEITFEEKLKQAKQAGAAGVIIYNNQPGPMIISADSSKQIPAVSILQLPGQQLAAQLKKGRKVTVSFDGQYGQNPLPYPHGGTVSSFSSWGPTPDLQFKPEITAPGGGILSTVRDHGYAVKSGTSMATPHVAGGVALIKQAYLKEGRNLQGRKLVETIKAAAMNTAEPIIDPREIATASVGDKPGKLPYSPRVQGAGMLQVAKAIKTPVVITDSKGKAGISLGEIGKSKTFTLYLDNKFGNKPLTYTIKNEFGVMTDLRRDGYNLLADTPLPGAKLSFSKNQLTVAPGKRAELKVTLQLSAQTPRNSFAEGYILFEPTAADVPALRVPYYGFYGDWDEPRIMDAPIWEEASQEKRTGVKTTWYHDKQNDKWKYRDYLGVTGVNEEGRVLIDPDKIAFSPNDDGHYDIASPSITFLRNAKQVSIAIADKQGHIVRSLVNDEKVEKFDQSKLGLPYFYTEKEEWNWDGKLYSPEKGEYVPAPDGAYRFVIRAKIDGKNADWQTMILPVRVDRKAPSVTASLSGKQLHWNSRDKDVQGYLLYMDGKKAGGPYSASEKGTHISQPSKQITLVAYDYAGNLSFVKINGKGDNTPPTVVFPNDLYEQLLVTAQSEIAIHGRVGGEDMLDRVKLKINQQAVAVEQDGAFATILKLPEGLNYVVYEAEDLFGNKRQFTQRIIVDKTAPELQLMNNGTEEVYYEPATKRMVMPLRIRFHDLNYKGKLVVNGQIIAHWEGEQLEKALEKYEVHQVVLHQGENRLLIEGGDEAGNKTLIQAQAYVDAAGGNATLNVGQQSVTYKAKSLPMPTLAVEKKSYQAAAGEPLSIHGKISSETPVQLEVFYGEQRIQPDLNDKGEFRLHLPEVKAGKQKISLTAIDLLGRTIDSEIVITGKDGKGVE
ncbi:S8 family serine peptidase [Brevibacillus fulvus]|uniref:Lactocepin n=1 Tax=Brevibacillus fulvus TaxID=1125967 RepID=A0A938XTB3_9BACL|nr:S8 family serine peptidase [Brevibacillus fulvus]MBM7590078.1 lactocepin [Brevibacillus fulvus]